MVYRQMQIWLGSVGFTYLALFSLQYSTGILYERNSFVFGSQVWLIVSGGVVGCAILFVAGVEWEGFRKLKPVLLIIFLIYLLALAVLLTGGFIDSPFSGAVSLYLGFFIALIKAGTHQRSSWLFVSLTIVCLVSPYAYLYWQGHAALQILNWHTSAQVTAARLIITITVLLITGWFGGKVSSELELFRSSTTTKSTVL